MNLDSENQHRSKNKILFQLLFSHQDQYAIPIRPFLIYQKIYLPQVLREICLSADCLSYN